MSELVIQLAVLLGGLVIVSDLYARRVPNAWLLAALVLGSCLLLARWMSGVGGPPWYALLGLLAGLATLLPFYAIGWMGAGDVKLFAVLGFLLGVKALLSIWLIASLLVGGHAASVLVLRRAGAGCPPLRTVQRRIAATRTWQRMLVARQGRKGLPYAAYLSMGALLTVTLPQLARWWAP